jgi:nitrate reductase NapE component
MRIGEIMAEEEEKEEQVHDHTVEHDCPVCRRREEAELARLKAAQNKWVLRCTLIAECLNRLRIIPRMIIGCYGYLVWMMVNWFMTLPEPTTMQVTLVTTICAMAPVVFGFYMNGGTTNSKK